MSDKTRSKEDVEFELGSAMVKYGSTYYRIKTLEADLSLLKAQLDDLNGEYLLLNGDKK